MPRPIIEVSDLSKVYRLGEIGATSLREETTRAWRKFRGLEPEKDTGEFWALKDVSFEVAEGEVLGIIGRNGAGKSTLLKLISRITEPTTGVIKLRGRVAALLEVGTGMHPELTGRENIYLNGTILGMRKKEIDRKLDEIIDFSGIEKHIDTPVKRYSSGMNVRLGFAVAAHLDPEILIVDEVLAVGDFDFQRKCLQRMDSVAKNQGRTVLFVSHNLSAVRNLCNKAIMISKGRLAIKDSTETVIEQYMNADVSKKTVVDLTTIKRTGSGAALFQAFAILDDEKNPKQEFDCGESLTFRIKICRGDATGTLNLNVGVAIEDPMGGRLVVLRSTYEVGEIHFKDNSITLYCKVSNLSLAPGEYNIKTLLRCNGVIADWPKDPIARISISAGSFFGDIPFDSSTFGMYILRSNWEIV